MPEEDEDVKKLRKESGWYAAETPPHVCLNFMSSFRLSSSTTTFLAHSFTVRRLVSRSLWPVWSQYCIVYLVAGYPPIIGTY